MSLFFQNIDPSAPSTPGECVPRVPPAFGAGGGHTRLVEKGVGGQYFGRRETQCMYSTYVSTLCVRWSNSTTYSLFNLKYKKYLKRRCHKICDIMLCNVYVLSGPECLVLDI
jgi:hypothetical protein